MKHKTMKRTLTIIAAVLIAMSVTGCQDALMDTPAPMEDQQVIPDTKAEVRFNIPFLTENKSRSAKLDELKQNITSYSIAYVKEDSKLKAINYYTVEQTPDQLVLDINSSYTFTVKAYDKNERVLASGSKTQTLDPGPNEVEIDIIPVADPVITLDLIDLWKPMFSLSESEKNITMAAGETLEFSAQKETEKPFLLTCAGDNVSVSGQTIRANKAGIGYIEVSVPPYLQTQSVKVRVISSKLDDLKIFTSYSTASKRQTLTDNKALRGKKIVLELVYGCQTYLSPGIGERFITARLLNMADEQVGNSLRMDIIPTVYGYTTMDIPTQRCELTWDDVDVSKIEKVELSIQDYYDPKVFIAEADISFIDG